MLKIISELWIAMGRVAALEYGIILPEDESSKCCAAYLTTEARGQIEVCSLCRVVTWVCA